ncbi:MAG: WD40 repeat protein [Pseudoalteromonas tetraodonis]|jgi:WD40 repeat protein
MVMDGVQSVLATRDSHFSRASNHSIFVAKIRLDVSASRPGFINGRGGIRHIPPPPRFCFRPKCAGARVRAVIDPRTQNSSPTHCPSCDNPLAANAPAGLCRRCLVASALAPADEVPIEEQPLGEIGDYEIYERIAMGGMGAIYRGRQRGLDREVAIKLIPEGRLAGSSDVARFRLEAGAAAELDHPNIVPIYDVGEEDGQHYFSMRLLRGGTLEDRAAEFGDPASAAALMFKIAKAVHFAHQGGILHRDLKPANILMTREGEPMVGDFGLAKRIGGGATGASLTQTGQLLGSPAYIAPEIAAGKARASVGSDLYSLGVMLYQLLVGQVPFSGATQLDVIRQAVESEPPRPRSIEANVPRDLETICLKCLEKDPAHRYASAGEFAEDLENFICGKTINARPVGAAERALKWGRRKPALASLAAVILLAISGFFLLLLVSGTKIRRERDIAIAERERARLETYASDMAAAFDALDDNNLAKARELVERQRPTASAGADLRDTAWRIAWSRCLGEEVRSFHGHSGGVTCLTISPDGRQLVSGSEQDGTVRFWDLDSGAQLLQLPRDLKVNLAYRARREAWAALGGLSKHGERIRNTGANVGNPISLAFTNRGKHLAIGCSDSYVRLYDIKNTQLDGWWPERIGRLTSFPVRKQLIVGSGADGADQDGVARVYDGTDATAYEPLRQLPGSGGFVSASPDGHAVATGSDKGHISVFDADFALRARNPHFGEIEAIALRNHGTCVAASRRGSPDVDFWNLVDDKRLKLEGHVGTVDALSYAPDASVFASGSADQTIRIWHGTSGKAVRVLKGHAGVVSSLVWLRDAKTLISGGGDGVIKFWNTGKDPEVEGWSGILVPMDLSTDGEWVVGSDEKKQKLQVGQSADGSGLSSIDTQQTIASAQFCGDHIGALMDDGEGEIHFQWHHAKTLERIGAPLPVGQATMSAFSPDGSRMSLGFQTDLRRFELWDLNQRKRIARIEDKTQFRSFNFMQFTPDGTKVICREWNNGGSTHVYDGVTGQLICQLETTEGSGLAISPDSRSIAIGQPDHAIAIWDLIEKKRTAVLTGHLYPVHLITWSPDGNCLASSAGSGSVRLWHVPTSRAIGSIDRHRAFRFLRFDPRGNAIYAKIYGGKLEVWDIPSLAEAGLQD